MFRFLAHCVLATALVAPLTSLALPLNGIELIQPNGTAQNAHIKALEALRNDQYQSAVRLAGDIIRIQPTDGRAHLIMLLGLAAEGDHVGVDNHLRELDLTLPETATPVRIALASHFVQTRQYERARSMLSPVRESHQTVRFHQLWGDLHQQAMAPAEAQAAYLRALALESDNESILASLVGTQMLAGDYDAALDYIKTLRKLAPENTRYKAMELTAYLKLGIPERGMGVVQESSLAGENDPTFLSVSALTLVVMGQYDSAHQVFQKLYAFPSWQDYSVAGSAICLTLNNKVAEATSHLGAHSISEPALSNLVWLAIVPNASVGERREKLTAMRQIWLDAGRQRINPVAIIGDLNLEDPVSRDLLSAAMAHLFHSQGFFEIAIERAQGVGDLEATPIGSLLKARILAKQGAITKTEALLTALIDEDPDLASPRMERAELFLRRGQPDQALREYEVTVQRADDLPELMIRLGDLYNAVGQPQKALVTYQRYLERYPDSFYALNQAAATLSELLGEHQRALPLAQRAYEQAPDNHHVVDTLSGVYQRLGRHREAEAVIAEFHRRSAS